MGALAWILAGIGALLGADARDATVGFLLGGAGGFTLGWLIRVAHRVRNLEQQIMLLQTLQSRPTEVPAQPRPTESVAPLVTEPAYSAPQPFVPEPATSTARVVETVEPTPGESLRATVTPESMLTPLFELVRRFFTDGNTVVRVGIVVLFFGVAFLLKFAIDRQLLPIELRLTATALGAIGLIVLGWRLRIKRTTYALLIQGGGIGIFYLTVFAAAKLYHLLPLGFALLLMVAVVFLSSVLALWQNSRALAAFGIAGGFLAPVLTSSGGGSHVMLFSYYALLNGGILGIAWYRAWRELNLLGFLFTFVIGTTWGVNYYQPHHFSSAEPFLILFFLFYVAIAILFALRQPLQLRGYVDGTLVFGVPFVGFALQAGMVHDIEFGMAFSAFVLGAFYIMLASLLWRRQMEGMRLLTESFLALGVAFATLAIPLALDGRWTAAAWAMEGAALVWIGVRQSRVLARNTGVLLQFAAGIFFLRDLYHPYGELPILNSVFLGAALISSAALFASWNLQRHRALLRRFEGWFEYALLGWGLLWWISFGLREIDRHLPSLHELNTALLFIAASAALLLWLWRRSDWPALRYPLLGLWPATLLVAFTIVIGMQPHFLAEWGVVPWLLLFAVQYRLLWRCERVMSERLVRFGHGITLGLLLVLLGHELAWAMATLLDAAVAWQAVAWIIAPLLMIYIVGTGRWSPAWPVRRFASTYQITALLPVALAMLMWNLLTLRLDGSSAPLPFVPLLNPVDLAQALVLLMVASWWWQHRAADAMKVWLPDQRLALFALAMLAFTWLNGVIARAVHHLGEVPYFPASLHQSVLFQTALSVSWTLVALLVTIIATRLRLRTLWLAGALLLALVVAKLFFIDLAKSGTIERIVSFLVVGGLMLVIGYFSPLPPKREGAQA